MWPSSFNGLLVSDIYWFTVHAYGWPTIGMFVLATSIGGHDILTQYWYCNITLGNIKTKKKHAIFCEFGEPPPLVFESVVLSLEPAWQRFIMITFQFLSHMQVCVYGSSRRTYPTSLLFGHIVCPACVQCACSEGVALLCGQQSGHNLIGRQLATSLKLRPMPEARQDPPPSPRHR